MTELVLRAQSALGSAISRVLSPRGVLRGLAVLAGCLALAVGGLWLGLRLSTPATYPSSLGSASFQVQLASHGDVEVFIPLTDWGLRAHAFSAPLKLHVEPRVLDRPELVAAANGDQAVLRQTLRDLTRDGRQAIARALRYMLLGTLLAALAGWVGLRVARCSSRRLLVGVPALTAVLALLLGGVALWRVQSTWDGAALSHPTYFARGAELIQLLNAAEHASRAGDAYTSKVEGALSGFASLLADPTAGEVDGGRRALVVSDLHANTLVLNPLSFYAQGQPVFFVGDFGNTGDATEIRTLVPRVARLGNRVIAVSGNHDSSQLMSALARRGATVLTSRGQLLANGRYGAPVVAVVGLAVAGFDDPLQYHGRRPDAPSRIFSIGQLPDPLAAATAAETRLLAWFRSLPRRPDVVLVHQNSLAQYLGRALYQQGYRWPLTILTGHDHLQHVNHDGPISVIDAGTVGAGGVYGVGTNFVGLGELHFDRVRSELRAADLIQVEPVSGTAQAQRIVIDNRCADRHRDCSAGVDYLDPREGPRTAALGGLAQVSPLNDDPAGLGARTATPANGP